MSLKHVFIIFLSLLCACVVFAENAISGGTIICAYYNDPRSLNPLAPPEAASANFQNLLFNGLIRFNERLEIVPELAESWRVSPDGITWTFNIRKDVRFHDGTELTADDVLFTFNWILNPANRSPLSALFQPVKSFSAEGTYVFKVLLKEPYGPLPYLMMRSIVPARLLKGGAVAEAEFGKHPIGTGPFKLSELKPGQLVFDANESYFEGRPLLDRIVFKVFADQKKAWASLVQGDTDVVTDLDREDYEVIRNDNRFKVYDLPDVFCYTLLFNLKDPLFSQQKIREAVSLVIDRTDIVEKALSGAGIPTTGPFRPGTWPYNPDPALQTFDPSKAAKILADLGWKDTDGDWVLEKGKEELRFTVLMDQGDRSKEATAQRLQWQLLQAGIRMDVEVLPFQELLQKRLAPGTFQAVLLQFNTSGDPDSSANTFWNSASIGRSNFGSYMSRDADRLIEEGRKTSDPGKRQEIYQKLHSLLASDVPAVFLYYKQWYCAVSSRLNGIGKTTEFFNASSIKNWYLTESR